MSKADNLLMSAGWIIAEETPKNIYKKGRIFYKSGKFFLVIDLNSKQVWTTDENDESTAFTVSDIIAINEKLKELWWL